MTVSYFLAADVGMSRTAAATARMRPDGTVHTASFPLGRHVDSVPSAVFVAEGELLFADAAVRRGIAQPERLIREFKRRLGDDVPIRAGDQRFTPEQLYARTVSWVIDTVAEREGRDPDAVAITVPVTWGAYRRELIQEAIAREGWHDVTLVTEPEAAARHYEADSPAVTERVLAVYDLGGGTFDAVVLRTGAGGVDVLGQPAGIDSLGGADFDDLVLHHALRAAGIAGVDLGLDPDTRIALTALRRECIEAKESLSFDSEAVIPVMLGDRPATVRLTRSEFEGMIEDDIARTVDVLAGTLETAGVSLGEVEAILLTGGSSRIPRIAQLLSERFDRPIAVDTDPKAIIALGAARLCAEIADQQPTASAAASVPQNAAAETVTEPASRPSGPTPHFARRQRPSRVGKIATIAGISAGALILAGGIVLSQGLGSVFGAGEPAPRETQSPVVVGIDPDTDPVADPTDVGDEASVPTPNSIDTPLLTPAPDDDLVVLFPRPDDRSPSSPADDSSGN